jgi:predicted DNA-binding transcriptional regulator AlpA
VVARLLGYSRQGSVNVYWLRHADFPSRGRCCRAGRLVWLRQDIEEWQARRRDTSLTYEG